MSRVVPLENPATAQWGRAVSRSDYNKMLKGFKPYDMDDRWTVVTDTPDARGNTVVHYCRSWLSDEHIALTVAAGDPDETEARRWATIVDISWKPVFAGEEVSEEDAKRRAVNFCKRLLDCEMED